MDIKILGVIPARIGSTRVSEKMLKDIHGKTLIQRTYERSKNARMLGALVIGTDSEIIVDIAKSFGADAIMTSVEHKTGTDRACEVAEKFSEFTPDIVAVIWGDEPLYPASVIDDCIQRLIDNPELDAVAAADKITDITMLTSDSVVKIVTNKRDEAMYISRAQIPYPYREGNLDYYHISGTMVMRMHFLKKYVSMEQSPLERIESVEQLRIIENCHKLGIVKVDVGNLGVNTPNELEEVRRIIGEQMGI